MVNEESCTAHRVEKKWVERVYEQKDLQNCEILSSEHNLAGAYINSWHWCLLSQDLKKIRQIKIYHRQRELSEATFLPEEWLAVDGGRAFLHWAITNDRLTV